MGQAFGLAQRRLGQFALVGGQELRRQVLEPPGSLCRLPKLGFVTRLLLHRVESDLAEGGDDVVGRRVRVGGLRDRQAGVCPQGLGRPALVGGVPRSLGGGSASGVFETGRLMFTGRLWADPFWPRTSAASWKSASGTWVRAEVGCTTTSSRSRMRPSLGRWPSIIGRGSPVGIGSGSKRKG